MLVVYFKTLQQNPIDNADFVFSDPFTAEVLSGTEEQAKNHGYFVLVHNVNSAEDV